MGASLSYPEVEINPERTYLVTGGNSGIGYETAKHIGIMGGHVIIACRNMEKAEAAVKRMQEDYEKELKKTQTTDFREPKKLNIEIMQVDLASFASTVRFIEEFKSRNINLNVLICNAGISSEGKLELTEDGYELMLQANYLSHLLIILHFIPILIKSGDDSRIVQTSSLMHKFGKLEIANINGEQSFGSMKFYGNSKLYQILSMYWLTRHLKDERVTIVSCHPGFVDTQMTRSSKYASSNFVQAFTRKTFDGATTIIKAATDPSFKGHTGLYFSDCKVKTPSSDARNMEKQDALMKYSLDVLNKYLPADIKEYMNL